MRRSVRLITAISVLAVTVSMLFTGCGKTKEEYSASRNILVEETNGSVNVSSGTGDTEAYKGMQLISGDKVRVGKESDMTLLIDMDKHLYATDNTEFNVKASGKAGKTKTKILLKEGCTLIGLDNKLGNDESFHVCTPNATMAVRGTVFTVTVSDEGTGKKTELYVKEGGVETKTIENGTEKIGIVSEGETVIFTGLSPENTDDADKTDELNGSDQSMQNTDINIEIPENRDPGKGLYGVYRGDGITVVIAKDVPYAYNRADGITVDDEIDKEFCVATVYDGAEPFFARSASMVSDTLITDYTYRDDESVHVTDTDYYIDSDTMYYHYRVNENGEEEYLVLKRTDEDQNQVYMSLIN